MLCKAKDIGPALRCFPRVIFCRGIYVQGMLSCQGATEWCLLCSRQGWPSVEGLACVSMAWLRKRLLQRAACRSSSLARALLLGLRLSRFPLHFAAGDDCTVRPICKGIVNGEGGRGAMEPIVSLDLVRLKRHFYKRMRDMVLWRWTFGAYKLSDPLRIVLTLQRLQLRSNADVGVCKRNL